MISIIIPTLNEESYLPLLLRSIQLQTYKGDYEIIVGDAKSTDKSRTIAQKFGCLVVDGGNPAQGRNAGAKVAKGDILVFLDADVQLPRNFLDNAISEFESRYLEVACSTAKPLSNDKDHINFFNISNLALTSFQPLKRFGVGSCIIATTRVHRRINGFNEFMHMGEDHDYISKAGKFGKYAVLESTFVRLSARRLIKDGPRATTFKYAINSIYQFLSGKPLKSAKYSFGEYDNIDDQCLTRSP
jgi:glycosyltransferase involved in cell wall biosynthesis